MFHNAQVELVPPRTTDFTIRPVTVQGTLSFRPYTMGGKTYSVFHILAERVQEYACEHMITIVDYQMGNLRSVQKAFRARRGRGVEISSDPDRIGQRGKAGLARSGVVWGCNPRAAGAAIDRAHSGSSSGRVARFWVSALGCSCCSIAVRRTNRYRVSSVFAERWNDSQYPRPGKYPIWVGTRVRKTKELPIWNGLPEDAFCYFVHSYYVVPKDPHLTAMQTDYHVTFCSMIQAGTCRGHAVPSGEEPVGGAPTDRQLRPG